MAPFPKARREGDLAFLALTTSKSMLQIAKLLSDNAATKDLKKFYRHLMVHCVFVSDHVNRIKSVLGPADVLITRALQLFESLISSGGACKAHDTGTYARQRALNHAWDCMRDQRLDSKIEYVRRCLVIPDSLGVRTYDDAFDEWQEDVVSTYPEDGTLLDEAQPKKRSRAEPSYVVRSAAQSMFEALAGSSKCDCHPVHELNARLCLGTYRRPEFDNDHDFDMFLACNQDLQEVRIYTAKDSTVRFVVSGESQTSAKKLDYKPMVVRALCKQVEKMQKTVSQRLELKVEKNRLLKLRSKTSSFTIDKKKPPVSLRQFIQKGSRLLTEKTKRILAVLLSYAVLHLHDTPWLQPSWDSSQILFFHTPSCKIPLRPFIQAQLVDCKGPADPSSKNHGDNEEPGHPDEVTEDVDPDDLDFDDIDPDDIGHPLPTLVTLAIMLMELYFATPFETLASNRDLQLPEGSDNCTRSLDVAVVFDAYKREIPRNSQFYHAIEKCLDPRTWQDEWGQNLTGDVMREMMYQEVIRPLEDELCDAFDYITIEDLDKIAETLDIGSWGQAIESQQHEQRALEKPTAPMNAMLPHFEYSTKLPHAFPTHFVVGLSLNSTTSANPSFLTQGLKSNGGLEYDNARFYDDEKPSEAHSHEELKDYLNWKAKYQAVYKTYIDPYLDTKPHSRVKIAVLDSGIDHTHNALDTGQIKRKRNWTSKFKKEVYDWDGHGTFTASLVIDYCPDAELSIAKVAEETPCSPSIIAEAIMTAVDEWGVDIISMSFGYPTNQLEGYPSLEKAILHAHSKHVLMFAAASNSGANLDRAYPARDPHVICIHSTDANGNRSRFSPTALEHDSNIATIGEAVQSSWPVKKCNILVNPDCAQTMSGTSYATPIAVGIAAFLLLYSRIHLADVADMMKRQDKMKAVLLKIAEKTQRSTNRDGYNYIALSLFSDHLFGKGKGFIDSTLEELLKR